MADRFSFAQAERLYDSDNPRAVEALEQHARARRPEAARLLGRYYAAHDDIPKACAWFAIAAELGDADSAVRLASNASGLEDTLRLQFHHDHALYRARIFGAGADDARTEDLEEAAPPRVAPPEGAFRLKEVSVTDQAGFKFAVPALRLMIPATWDGQGQVLWAPAYDNPANVVHLSFHAMDPANSYSFDVYPSFTWSHAIGPMGPMGPEPLSAAEYIEQRLLPQARSSVDDLEVVEHVSLPQIADVFQKAATARIGSKPGVSVSVDVAQVRVRYRYEGAPYEEWFLGAIQSLETNSSELAADLGGEQGVRSYTLTAERLYSFRAPQGELQQYEGLMKTMVVSARLDLRWEAAIRQTIRSVDQLQPEDEEERARVAQEAMTQIEQMPSDAWQKRQESRDRVHHWFIQAISGLESWADPSTGQVLAFGAGHQSAWRSKLREVIISKDPDFDANAVFDGSWVRLRRVG